VSQIAVEGASEQIESPKTSVRTSIPPQRYSGYVALMSNMIESEPTCFEEVVEKKAWRDSMIEEYISIIKNDVWEIVPVIHQFAQAGFPDEPPEIEQSLLI